MAEWKEVSWLMTEFYTSRGLTQQEGAPPLAGHLRVLLCKGICDRFGKVARARRE